MNERGTSERTDVRAGLPRVLAIMIGSLRDGTEEA
jgi:hypothetical protein